MESALSTLVFDLDDTLMAEESSAEAAFVAAGEPARERYAIDPVALHLTLRKACREIWYAFSEHPYCKRVGISSWEGMWAEFTGPGPELERLRSWAPAYRFESWRAALGRHGVDDPALAGEMAEAFPRLRRRIHVVYPDTLPALGELENYALGLLTNGASDLQRRKIEGAGIGGYFREILISGDIGFGKPDPRIYSLMLRRLGAAPRTTLMIGNNLVTDVAAAQRAGMRAVWVNRTGAARAGDVVPDWEIADLSGLGPVLEAAGGVG
ncbi:MAG: HAD family hydrolase [Acidobacteria bacterium]|nr:HAD family hydrolase [Acidobacteriota bacterium]